MLTTANENYQIHQLLLSAKVKDVWMKEEKDREGGGKKGEGYKKDQRDKGAVNEEKGKLLEFEPRTHFVYNRRDPAFVAHFVPKSSTREIEARFHTCVCVYCVKDNISEISRSICFRSMYALPFASRLRTQAVYFV